MAEQIYDFEEEALQKNKNATELDEVFNVPEIDEEEQYFEEDLELEEDEVTIKEKRNIVLPTVLIVIILCLIAGIFTVSMQYLDQLKQNSELKNTASLAISDKDVLSVKYDELVKTKDELDQKINEIVTERDALQKQLSEVSSNSNAQNSAAASQITSMQKQIANLTKERDTYKKKSEELQKQLDSIKKAVSDSSKS